MNTSNAIAPTMNTQITASPNETLGQALVNVRVAIRQAAQANVDAIVAEDDGYSDLERRAMLVIDELKQVNSMDLAAVMFRGELINTIINEGLLSFHPGRYETMEQMAKDQGVSLTELSQTLDLVNVIFPYLEEHYPDTSIAAWWEAIGKSNFKELVPILKSLITGEPGRESVQLAVRRVLEDTAATMQVAHPDEGAPAEPEVVEAAVDTLLEHGANLSNRQLREQIRGDRTPSIQASVVVTGDTRLLVAEMSEDQWLMFQRRLNGRINEQIISLPNDPRQRQIEANRIPELRALTRLLSAQ